MFYNLLINPLWPSGCSISPYKLIGAAWLRPHNTVNSHVGGSSGSGGSLWCKIIRTDPRSADIAPCEAEKCYREQVDNVSCSR